MEEETIIKDSLRYLYSLHKSNWSIQQHIDFETHQTCIEITNDDIKVSASASSAWAFEEILNYGICKIEDMLMMTRW